MRPFKCCSGTRSLEQDRSNEGRTIACQDSCTVIQCAGDPFTATSRTPVAGSYKRNNSNANKRGGSQRCQGGSNRADRSREGGRVYLSPPIITARFSGFLRDDQEASRTDQYAIDVTHARSITSNRTRHFGYRSTSGLSAGCAFPVNVTISPGAIVDLRRPQALLAH